MNAVRSRINDNWDLFKIKEEYLKYCEVYTHLTGNVYPIIVSNYLMLLEKRYKELSGEHLKNVPTPSILGYVHGYP